MIAFFFTMPMRRMIRSARWMEKSVAADHQRQERADAGGKKRGEDGDRVDVAPYRTPARCRR